MGLPLASWTLQVEVQVVRASSKKCNFLDIPACYFAGWAFAYTTECPLYLLQLALQCKNCRI